MAFSLKQLQFPCYLYKFVIDVGQDPAPLYHLTKHATKWICCYNKVHLSPQLCKETGWLQNCIKNWIRIFHPFIQEMPTWHTCLFCSKGTILLLLLQKIDSVWECSYNNIKKHFFTLFNTSVSVNNVQWNKSLNYQSHILKTSPKESSYPNNFFKRADSDPLFHIV